MSTIGYTIRINGELADDEHGTLIFQTMEQIESYLRYCNGGRGLNDALLGRKIKVHRVYESQELSLAWDENTGLEES